MSKKQFQQFLISKGADLGSWGADGVVGNVTTQALYDTFANKEAEAITFDAIVRIARSHGATTKQMEAFSSVESNGQGFLPTGHPKILWERHYMWRRIRIKIPFISDPTPGGYTLDADRDGINDSWEKLMEGCRRNPVAAFESCSWGKFQIMGAHWKALGYDSVFDFAWSMVESEAGHYEAFSRFIRHNRLSKLLAQVSGDAKDNVPLVRRYNGKNHWKHNYAGRIAHKMRRG